MSNLSLKQKNLFSNLISLALITLISLITFYGTSLASADKVFKENSKAVVVVVTYNEKGEPISQGSGFIVRADGAIVTNYHVISNAKNIKAKAGDKIFDVEGLIYEDKENDLIILKVKGTNLPIVKLGKVETTNVGEKIYVIGSPQGLENTISDGILSGIREITIDQKILQITAPISAGSSGGPVFNKDGEVIGIATFLIKEAQNLNFAMPITLVKDRISAKKVKPLAESELFDYTKTAEYWFYLGLYLSEAGQNKDAIDAYKQSLRINPDNVATNYNLGIKYDNLGMYDDAIDAYKQAIRINPDYANAHYSLGISYGNLGMYKDAIDAYKQAIRINPDDEKACYNLGNTYDNLGMYKDAIDAYKQAIRINPDYEKACYNLGNTYGKLGMYKDAIEANKQAIRINPDYADTHYNIGIAYGKLGMYKDAIEANKQAIRINPDYTNAHYNLGITYLMLQDKSSALEEFKILKTLDPKVANVLFNQMYK